MAKLKWVSLFLFAMLSLLLMSSCTIVPIDPDGGTVVGSAILQARDVDEYLDDYWDAYLLPEIYERRVTLSTLVSEASASGWDSAGEAYGEIRGAIGASYNFLVYGIAVVVETNTESRNGFILVEIEGQGQYEVRVSIGPVLRGSAIRDSLRFVDFNQFVNQMDFASLATALNRLGNENAMQSADLFALDGQTISFTGAFTVPGNDNIISIMPIFLEVL